MGRSILRYASLAMLLSLSPSVNAGPAEAHEYILRLQAPDALATEVRPDRQTLTITGPRLIPHRAPRVRALTPQAGQLLIVAVDNANAELARTLVTDPRVVNGEIQTGEPGNRWQRSYKTEVTFPVVLPAQPGVARLQVFQPVTAGDSVVPQLLADAAVTGGGP